MAIKDTEYYKSLTPSQLFAERGSDIVVFNPGSANLRIGFASQLNPIEFSHVISWFDSRKVRNESLDQGQDKEDSSVADRRKLFLEEVERELHIPVYGSSVSSKTSEGREITAEVDSDFQWSNVRHIPSAAQDDKPKYNKYICGNEALKIPSHEPYTLRWPIRRGHLNVSPAYPMPQITNDISIIWDWVLSEKLNLRKQNRSSFSAVLVAPDTLEVRELKELLNVLLTELGFFSVVVHQESVAVSFGNGISSACVVNVGAHVSSVVCVEEGTVLPSTRVILPFGGEDISECVGWVQKQRWDWPFDWQEEHERLLLLDSLKETNCQLVTGLQCVETQVEERKFGCPTKLHNIKLTSAVNVPPMGLFLPQILHPDRVPVPSKRYRAELEETLDEFLTAELGRSSDWSNPVALLAEKARANGGPIGKQPIGVHEAIVLSVMALGKPELQAKLFTSMVLVGGGSQLPGFANFLEHRILGCWPMNSASYPVEILPNRHQCHLVAWKGGQVLGVLDFLRESWVQREEWLADSSDKPQCRRYRDSTSMQTQMLWYSAALD